MADEDQVPNTPPGPGVDASGQAVLDPTKNVLDLVNAEAHRQDDLRHAAEKLAELRADYNREIREIEAKHSKELRVLETYRLDAIRAVDVAAVQQAAQVSATQATTLAAQVATSAETLRTQVAAAATAATVALAAALEPIQKDIADLRRAQYEAQGVKAQSSDERSNSSAIWAAAGVIIAAIAILVVIAIAVMNATP